MADDLKFYSLDEIEKLNALYNVIIGERSNGKSYACLKRILDDWFNSKGTRQGAIIRRYAEDFKRGRASRMFDNLVANGVLDGKKYDGIEYKVGAFYLYKYDAQLDKRICDDTPFCYAFAISEMMHDKSTSYPNVYTIVFDEFLTRDGKGELANEFVDFMNVLSTIIRQRDGVKIYMLGNTVNMHSIYFKEMGLKKVAIQKKGTIDLYRYGNSELTVAVEYCGSLNKSKPSDKYFAFDNPKLQMITGGEWELALYPHLPEKYKPKEIVFCYFIIFENELLKCDIVKKERGYFTFIHKTTNNSILYPHDDLIFSDIPKYDRNYRRFISAPFDKLGKKIWKFFIEDKVYYQDNEIGEIVRTYLQFCRRATIIKA